MAPSDLAIRWGGYPINTTLGGLSPRNPFESIRVGSRRSSLAMAKHSESNGAVYLHPQREHL